MSKALLMQQCQSCHVDAVKVSDDEIKEYIKQIPDWSLQVHDQIVMLTRVYSFKNYKFAWAFANKVSELAEIESHHPSILLEWGQVTVTWWTHAIKALHKNDFICAAKTDKLL